MNHTVETVDWFKVFWGIVAVAILAASLVSCYDWTMKRDAAAEQYCQARGMTWSMIGRPGSGGRDVCVRPDGSLVLIP